MALRYFIRDEDIYFPTGKVFRVHSGWLYITNNNVKLLVEINPVVGLGRGVSYKVAYECDVDQGTGKEFREYSKVIQHRGSDISQSSAGTMLDIEPNIEEISEGDEVIHNYCPWYHSADVPFFYTVPIKHDNDIEGRITMYVDTARKSETNGWYSGEYPMIGWPEYILHAMYSSTTTPDLDVEKALRDKSCPEDLSFDGIKVTKGYMSKGYYFEMREGLLFKRSKKITFEQLLEYLWAKWREQVGLS